MLQMLMPLELRLTPGCFVCAMLWPWWLLTWCMACWLRLRVEARLVSQHVARRARRAAMPEVPDCGLRL